MSSGRSLGKWETKDCKTTKAFPVCKKYIGLPKEPEVLPKPSDPCPPGWHNGSGLACYKVKCYSCWMLIFHYCLAPILSAMKCVLYTAHVARCGKHSLNSRAVSTDPEWMALVVQHSCPCLADWVWQLALAVSPNLLLTKCNMSVQRDPADRNWLGVKSRGSSGWGVWAKCKILIHIGSKEGGKELSASAAPKWSCVLGFVVHPVFWRTPSLKTHSLACYFGMNCMLFFKIFLVKKNREVLPYGIGCIWNKFCQLNFKVWLLSNKLRK